MIVKIDFLKLSLLMKIINNPRIAFLEFVNKAKIIINVEMLPNINRDKFLFL